MPCAGRLDSCEWGICVQRWLDGRHRFLSFVYIINYGTTNYFLHLTLFPKTEGGDLLRHNPLKLQSWVRLCDPLNDGERTLHFLEAQLLGEHMSLELDGPPPVI